ALAKWLVFADAAPPALVLQLAGTVEDGALRGRGALLPHLPERLRGHRITQALAFGVHAAAHRERTRSRGGSVLPFAVHVGDLLDGLIGFLQAPVSAATSSVLSEHDPSEPVLPLHP
ncbi:hypothetical protein ACWDF5_48785, partial [Streptomyces sp. NPDC001076]